MKKSTSKKGFTLVELLVVIAILAVLATVSVVGYLGFTKKAKVSNDISLTTQMNKILQADEAGGDTFDTPYDAIEALKEGGLDVTKLTPTTDGYSYVYDIKGEQGKKMILVDENKNVIAPSNVSLNSSNQERYFFFAGTSNEVDDYTKLGYSVYLKSEFETSTTLEVQAGIDVGDNEDIDVKLSSSEEKTYLFRTNGGTFTVDAGSATVHHYGEAMKINVTAVAGNSYHEFGKAESIDFEKGRFVAEEGAEVSFLNVTATDTTKLPEIVVNSGSEVVAVTAKSEEVANQLKNKVSGSGSTSIYNETEVKDKTVYVNNNGAIKMYDKVNDAIKEYTKSTIKLLKDVNEDIVITSGKNIVLELNDKTIKNSTSDTIRIELNGSLTINGNGIVDNETHGKAAIFNNGLTILNGGKYTRSKEASTSTDSSNGNSYYNILNHGEITINDGVEVISSGAFSSLVANGYYSYSETSDGERKAYINGTNNAEPKLTINGGSFEGGINTIKNDDGATLTIKDGSFKNTTQYVIFNANKAYIYGGTFDMPSSSDKKASLYAFKYDKDPNNVYTEIRGGTFNGDVENESSNATKLVVYGGTFNGQIKGGYTDNRNK